MKNRLIESPVTSIFIYLLQGATLALPATLMPGPFQAFLVSCTLRNGWKRTLPIALVPLATDGPVIVLVLYVLTKIPPWSLNTLHVAGGFVILYLAWTIFKATKSKNLDFEPSQKETRRTFLGAVAMNIVNPNPYIFWSVVAGPILLEGWHRSMGSAIGFITGFYGTFVMCLSAFIVMIGTLGSVNPKASRLLSRISFWALLTFGFYEIMSGFFKIASHYQIG
jgi:threonine/homoserine/homoserine lactone efflux protein